MQKIVRATTEYDPVADRLKLLVELESGAVQILWLTRRLVERLIQEVTGRITHQYEYTNATREHTSLEHNNSVNAELINHCIQRSAKGSLDTSQAPVKACQATMEWLVVYIDIRQQASRWTFVFRENKDGCSLSFDEQALRQWLHIVLANYRTADWPLDSWPKWMLDTGYSAHIH